MDIISPFFSQFWMIIAVQEREEAYTHPWTMGCGSSISVVDGQRSSVVDSLAKDTFSLHQRCLVLRTWRYLANDMTENGKRVFAKVFELKPEVKSLFQYRNDSMNELVQNASFQAHALRYMQAVGAVMENIEDPDVKLTDLLVNLGRQHIHVGGFRIEYFDAFLEGMMFVWQQQLGHKFSGDTAVAWKIVFNFIRCKMAEGYQMELLKSHK